MTTFSPLRFVRPYVPVRKWKASIASHVPVVGSDQNRQGQPGSQLQVFCQSPTSFHFSAMIVRDGASSDVINRLSTPLWSGVGDDDSLARRRAMRRRHGASPLSEPG